MNYKLRKTVISEVNLSFIAGFEFYLKSKKKPCSHNTTLKNIEILRKVVHIALNNEWIHKDPFHHYKSKYEPTDRGYLTTEELHRLQTKELSNDRMDRVRDIFVFCCYTGLSYVDVNKVTQNHLVTWIDGKIWIDIGQTKNGSKSKIPLLPQAMAILDKYREYPGLEIVL